MLLGVRNRRLDARYAARRTAGHFATSISFSTPTIISRTFSCKAPHNYNRQGREASYAWFATWLKGAPAKPTESGASIVSPANLLLWEGRERPRGSTPLASSIIGAKLPTDPVANVVGRRARCQRGQEAARASSEGKPAGAVLLAALKDDALIAELNGADAPLYFVEPFAETRDTKSILRPRTIAPPIKSASPTFSRTGALLENNTARWTLSDNRPRRIVVSDRAEISPRFRAPSPTPRVFRTIRRQRISIVCHPRHPARGGFAMPKGGRDDSQHRRGSFTELVRRESLRESMATPAEITAWLTSR